MIYIYIISIALTTYLIRVLPLTLIRGEIQSVFLKSFLFYVPYACLTAMTLPAIFWGTRSIYSGVIGFVFAVVAAKKSGNLVLVAGVACLTVYIVELFLFL